MASGTRAKLIQSGLQLFLVDGFTQVGLDQVVQQADLTKTTFYNHFESKEELIRAAIEAREAELFDTVSKAVEATPVDPPIARLLAVLDAAGSCYRDMPNGRCLLLSAAIEYPSLTDPTHMLAIQYRKRWVSYLRDLAEKAGVADAEAFALRYWMLIDGSTVRWQVDGDTGSATIARRSAELLIDDALAAS